MKAPAIHMAIATLLTAAAVPLQAQSVDRDKSKVQSASASPALLLPADASTRYIPTPSFTWSPVEGAAYYQIQLDDDPKFADPVITDTTHVPHYVHEVPLPWGKIYWRVRAVGEKGDNGAYSEVRSLTLEKPSKVFDIPNQADTAAVQRILAEAGKNTPAVVRFAAKGEYTFDGASRSLIDLRNVSNLIVDGQSANIVFTGNTGLSSLNNCENILIRDLTVRYTPTRYAVGVVRKVDEAKGTLDVTIDGDKTLRFDDEQLLDHWTWGVVLDKETPGKIKDNTPLVVSLETGPIATAEVDGKKVYTLKTKSLGYIKYFAPGDKYIVYARNGGGVGLAAGSGSRDVTYVNITNYGAAAGHYSFVDGSGLKVLGCRSLIPEGAWFGGNADGVHVRYNDLGPWVEGCTFEGVGDDAVAIYKKGIFVLKQESPNSLRVDGTFFNLKPGHAIRIFNPRDGVLVAEAKVSAVEPQEAGAGGVQPKHFLVTLESPLSTSVYTKDADPLNNDQIFNASLNNSDFVLRNNTFARIRRFGSIIRASSGVIENNRYDRISNIPIVLRNEPDHWRNGLASDHILILNNTITDSGYVQQRENKGQIHVTLYKMGREAAAGRLHRNILIAGNRIHNWQERGISVTNADGVRITDNMLTSDVPFNNDRPHYGIYVDNSANVEIANNTFADSRSGYTKIEITDNVDAVKNGDKTPVAKPAAGSHADAAARPNILLLITDDESWFERSRYGVQSVLPTPQLDRVAEAGALFTNGHASAPSCAPSRAAILTGRNFWELQEGAFIQAYVPKEYTVLPRVLAEHGYLTGYTGKGWGPGLCPEGIAHDLSMAGTTFSDVRISDPEPGISPIDYAANFKKFLESRSPNQPFFFWAGLLEPHSPHDAENYRRLEKKYGITLDQVYLPDGMKDTTENRKERANFLYEICYADEQLGKLLDQLESIGELKNTLVIVTSDNGTFIRGGKGKITPYEAATREPLAIMYPARMPAGRVVTDFVNFADFAPTILEAAGITPPDCMSGRSFSDVLRSSKSGRVDPKRDYTVTGLEWHGELDPVSNSARTLHTDDFALIARYDNVDDKGKSLDNAAASTPVRYELYDLKTDPWQNHDLAADPAHAATLKKLTEQLHNVGRSTGDPRVTGKMDTFRRTRQFVQERKRSNYRKDVPLPREHSRSGG